MRQSTLTLRRDGSVHSADSAGRVKVFAFATNKPSVHTAFDPLTNHLLTKKYFLTTKECTKATKGSDICVL
jgi:hypothetical protein